jgi:predicted DNA-binding protein (UPF0251 family)
MTDETWAPVREFPDHYEISSHGRLRRKGAPALRKPQIARNGYVVFTLSVDGRILARSAHRMVVDAFLGPIPEGLHVNHKDGVKTNCHVENLELVTISENRIHSYRVLGIKPNRVLGQKNRPDSMSWDEVQAVRVAYEDGQEIKALARHYGVSRQCVWRIVTNKSRLEA